MERITYKQVYLGKFSFKDSNLVIMNFWYYRKTQKLQYCKKYLPTKFQ